MGTTAEAVTLGMRESMMICDDLFNQRWLTNDDPWDLFIYADLWYFKAIEIDHGSFTNDDLIM